MRVALRAARRRGAFGNSAHLWMFDYPAMQAELQRAGFTAIRPAAFGDAEDPKFAQVETASRFVEDGLVELAMQASKPLR